MNPQRAFQANRPPCDRWCPWRSVLPLLLLASATLAPAAVYDFSLGDAGNRSLRLNVPDAWPVVRGIVIFGNGAGGDSRAMATDPELAALGDSIGFAVVGTAYWSNFALGYEPTELSGFEFGLQRLGATSGHPELPLVPWLPIGHSNGGQMSYGLNALRPEKVIAMVVSKGGYHNIARPAAAALQTPGLLIAGERDLDNRNATIRDAFFGNRPRGALWSWVEDQGVAHERANSNDLTLPFVEAMVRLRLGNSWSAPTVAPAQLMAARESNGWLTDPDSYKTGLAVIAPYADYAKDKSVAGWLPDRRLAYVFRAFASYDKASVTATLTPSNPVVIWGTQVTYTIGEPVAPWSAIDFYEGDTLVKTTSPADNVRLAATTTLTESGYAVFHALVTLADGRRRTTVPRRVWVRPAALGDIAGPAAVPAGGTAVFVAGAPRTISAIALRWQFNTGAGWSDFSPGSIAELSPATSEALPFTLTLRNVPPALSGVQIRYVGSIGGVDVTSQTATLTVVAPPAIALLQALPAGALAAGASLTLAARGPAAGVTWQWCRDGSPIAGATSASYSFVAGTTDAGRFSVVATGTSGLTSSLEAGTLNVVANARLVNLAARARLRAGDGLIAGFVTSGDVAASGGRVGIRGLGPALGLPPFGLADALPDPRLTFFDEAGANRDTNTGWDANLAATFARLGAFPLARGSRDAALLETVASGAYSVELRSSGGAPGIGVVEIYDANERAASGRLANLAARAHVGGGSDALIGGFVIAGDTAATLLVRAIGPALASAPFGLAGTLAKPVLAIYDAQGRVIVTLRGWSNPPRRGDSPVAAGVSGARADVTARVGAFALTPGSADCAVIVTLPPGAYTAQITSDDETTGLALIECYEVK